MFSALPSDFLNRIGQKRTLRRMSHYHEPHNVFTLCYVHYLTSLQKYPMNINFRHQARDAFGRAKAELATNAIERLKYAALELRMAMECLTYERASIYANELPPTQYETWQPWKLMLLLLEIDPCADKDSSVAVGIEEEPGKEAGPMTIFGSRESFKPLRHKAAL
jgi:hypothetical protein